MSGKLIVAVAVASLIAVSSGLQSLAQAPATAGGGQRGQGRPPITQVGPCVGRPMTPECAVSRLDGIDNRLNGIDEQLRQLEAALRDLQARPAGTSANKPPIAQPVVGDTKADADSEYLQRQIDGLKKTVKELVDRVNGK